MKLNGYTLKAVKMMETPDGIAYSGNIYYDSKKIGMAHNSGSGGMTDVYLDPNHSNHYKTLDEDFVERLFTLNDYEAIFKENMKSKPNAGTAFVICANPFDLKNYICGKNATIEGILEHLNKTKPELVIESIELFHSLDDFNIDADHQPDEWKSVEGKQEKPKEKPSVMGRIQENEKAIAQGKATKPDKQKQKAGNLEVD